MDITWITFFPLLTAAVLLLIPSDWKGLIKAVTFLGGLVTLILAFLVFQGYESEEAPRALESELRAREDRIIHGSGSPYFGAIDVERHLPEPGKSFTEAEYEAHRQEVAKAPAGAEAVEAWEELVEIRYALGVPVGRNMRYVEYVPWISSFNVNYFMGVDGLSLPLVLLTALLCFLCYAYSWTVDKGTKGFFILFLILETGLIGVFCALDFFLFYVFWEIVLLPMYFLIGVWGGPDRLYAAIKFFIYTLVGSVLMLIVMLVMYFTSEPHTFNLLTLMHVVPDFRESLQWWLFIGLFIGFAIKVPVFPFHTWLPDAHVEAPTPVSVILAGILLKMGGYGLFRFSYPMLPDAALHKYFIGLIAVLGMVNIIYGAFCAMAQRDFKKLVAYSSISHMGYVLLGLAAMTHVGVKGAALQMLNHGISSAMLFLLVGVIYDRAHHRDLSRFGGIGLQMPWYTGLATVGLFASLGLPGLNGFISEFMCFFGAWNPSETGGSLITTAITSPTNAALGGISSKWIVLASLLGIVLAACYILWTIQRVYLGTIRNEEYKKFPDATFREHFALAPLAFLCVFLGVYPVYIIGFMDRSLSDLTDMVRSVLVGG